MVAVATLKIDALFFVLGTLLGIFLFGSTVDSFWAFWNTSGFHGRLTIPDWLGVPPGGVVLAVIVMALGMFWGAEKLERVFTARRQPEDNP